MTLLNASIGRLKPFYLNPRLLAPEGIVKPIGPFHPIAAWRTDLFQDANGMYVADAYDLVWVWSPSSLVARVYFERVEPPVALDYWTAEVVYEQARALDEHQIVEAIEDHQRRLAGALQP